MKNSTLHWISILFFCGLVGCGNKLEEKGFAVSPVSKTDENEIDGISQDSLSFPTRPSNILLTGVPQFRLATIYKVNYNKDSTSFIGSNNFHYSYEEIAETNGNQWNNNLMPGFEIVYGYNLVNISHFDTENQRQKNLFDQPVLIKNLYFPSFSKDTLNYKPVARNYYIVSVYNEDTNKDRFINVRDLRRLYRFDVSGSNKSLLVPINYSVYKSEYDSANDFMYIFAKLDQNNNGQIEDGEVDHIFWIDLKNPERTGRLY
ncbi:MAG TPA: hypothetical protein VGK39_01780 [Cyclobacteriaceae bacterium]